MGSFSVVAAASIIFSAMKRLFKLDKATRGASVELWVVMTALFLLIRFLFDSLGARVYSTQWAAATVQILALLNYSMVSYTLGQMQLSAARVNDFFQVWAALLVTLQYSVKVGRPYSRSKEIPLLDIMSSLWTANLLRVQTVSNLKIPLWLIWALNAARIVSYFFSSKKGEAGNEDNTRIITDYMRYEHTFSADADPAKMFGYNYLVYGEDRRIMQILQEQRRAGSGRYRIKLDPKHQEIITVEKIWDVAGGESGLLGRDADPENRLKDVCLLFALHKQLRRLFFDLSIHEATAPAARHKTRRLVFDYILQNKDNYERAFRVTEVELCFLRDTFYSRHAAMFVEGFPFSRMLLSVMLILAIVYIAYPVIYIPQRIDPADKNLITHGVFVTRLFICLIVAKELWEICIYLFGPWTKVRMICMYAKHQCLQRPLAEKAMRLVFCLVRRGRWNRQIGQYNVLISARSILSNTTRVKLAAEAQTAIFDSFKLLQQDQQALGSYFSNAFGSNQHLSVNLAWTQELDADTHKILVWHIATGLCEINLSDDAKQRQVYWMRSKPLINMSSVPAAVWVHYITAVSISNYCAYLLTKKMVPENGLVAKRVFNEVRRETRRAIFYPHRYVSLHEISDKLKKIAVDPGEDRMPCPSGALDEENKGDDGAAAEIAIEEQFNQSDVIEYLEEGNSANDLIVTEEPYHEQPINNGPNGDLDGFDNTIIKRGSELALQLTEAYTGDDQEGLWRDLAKFWVGFLLHLAASTRAAKHKMHLPTNGELLTHLWALLSHAGYVSNVGHGDQLLDPEDLNDVNPLS